MATDRMTVNQLYKLLGRLIEEGEGRRYVVADKASFIHPCEADGCVILPVKSCAVEMVLQGDGDGGTTINADGSERYRREAVLRG